jgi:hypothetical protein
MSKITPCLKTIASCKPSLSENKSTIRLYRTSMRRKFDGRSGRNLGLLPGARTLSDLLHLAAVDSANGHRLHSERKSELVRHHE